MVRLECDRAASIMRGLLPTGGLMGHGKENLVVTHEHLISSAFSYLYADLLTTIRCGPIHF